MKGISGIVATAILLALTIAGGVLLYTYVTGYLSTAVDSGKLVVENAYYIKSLNRLTIEVRNVGTRGVKIDRVELIVFAGNSTPIDLPDTLVAPGETRQVTVNIASDPATLPQYVIVVYDNNLVTEPIPVRIR